MMMVRFAQDAFRYAILIASLSVMLCCLAAADSSAQEPRGGNSATSGEPTYPLQTIRTDSPRETMATFLRLRDQLEKATLAYREHTTRQGADAIYTLGTQLGALIDLSAVPRASRLEVGRDTIAYLLDILGRIDLPPLETIPDDDAMAAEDGPQNWRIPNTPLQILRIKQGPREGEFLFSERTVHVAPRYFRGIQAIPLRSSLGIESWRLALLQTTGPLIPASLVHAMPSSLQETWFGTPAWKVIAVVLTSLAAAILIVLLNRFARTRSKGQKIGSLIWKLVTPLSIVVALSLLEPFIDLELIISGAFSRFVDFVETLLLYFAYAWIFWLGMRILFEWLILSPHIPEESLDANLLRLTAMFLGIIGVTVILAYGGEKLGLPVLSLLAGLGIGGFAVALAIRPTLENLIGGVILYLDKPVRVGDLCSFGEHIGRVEHIGVRSTQLRALDRKLVSIPNAQFVDMQLVNWAKCDQMLIKEVIGLRYETTTDQMRFVLANLREMFHAHPQIDNKTVRVRFSGYGDSTLDVTIRVYAETQDLNEFHAIREDVLMRTYDIVSEAGSGFAFPSRTVYMGQDGGLDKGRTGAAEKRVDAWRRSGELPFPRLSTDRLDEIEDTLDYPPEGSPEASEKDTAAEPLSTDGVQKPAPRRRRTKKRI